jgi:hypothetical protein
MPETEKLSSDIWIENMRSGEFEKAWQFSDKVLASRINRDYQRLPRHFQSIWDGTPLNNKRVLIRCYHGLGDTIQFIRYALLVKQIAREVIVWAQSSLIDLLKTVEGIDRLLPLHDGVPEVEFDVDVEIMELPHIFRTTLATIPAEVPYIHVEPLKFTATSLLKVGLVWQAGDWDQSRNVPFSELKPLFQIEGLEIIILQANARAAGWKEGQGINPGAFDLIDYAGMIKGLDLLISVDSMPAHLAGALNVPVLVMLQHHADWRWMKGRRDSLWYPSMRLFRQQKQGEWQSVVREIAGRLKEL